VHITVDDLDLTMKLFK